MSNQTIQLQGMSCSACQKVVEKRLSKIEGITAVAVDVGAGTAAITAAREIAIEEMQRVLEDTHYTIIS